MTLVLKFDPGTERELAAKARERGVSLQDFVQAIVQREVLASSVPGASDQTRREEAVNRMRAFSEKHRLSLGEPLARKLLHEGHRL